MRRLVLPLLLAIAAGCASAETGSAAAAADLAIAHVGVALRGATIYPARALGVDDAVGSIAAGREA
ncbi:MAG TPA: amidohydrolase family protein, partial [Longimicrobiaceae bacterium]|nr:amidohydrolase family protein [Longimicrobiaceae bacterium]